VTVCVACGFVGESEGPTHAYMSPSAACWARYGEVLAREFNDPGYFRAHRLMTDAYCGQHSVGGDRRARQSLHIHLAALMLWYEDGVAAERIVDFLRKAARSKQFPALAMPDENRLVTIDAVHGAQDAAGHVAAVQEYARAVFDAWQVHHPVFRALINRVFA